MPPFLIIFVIISDAESINCIFDAQSFRISLGLSGLVTTAVRPRTVCDSNRFAFIFIIRQYFLMSYCSRPELVQYAMWPLFTVVSAQVRAGHCQRPELPSQAVSVTCNCYLVFLMIFIPSDALFLYRSYEHCLIEGTRTCSLGRTLWPGRSMRGLRRLLKRLFG